jgi:two-component system response regulator PilR (NtrC family)
MTRAASYLGQVLLVGEDGTPLEAVARDIDALGSASPLPFVTMDCRVNGDHSFESLLCDNRGTAPCLLTQALGGALFIDAIEALQPRQQAQLLHALEHRKMQTIMGACVPMTARVIVASRCDLQTLVDSGRFDAELYYRLRSFTIRFPPLRERMEDIGLIADAMWRGVIWDPQAVLPYDVALALREYDWPGNHVELESVLQLLHAWCGTRRPTAALLRSVLQEHDAPLLDDPPRRRSSRVQATHARPPAALALAAAGRRRPGGGDD